MTFAIGHWCLNKNYGGRLTVFSISFCCFLFRTSFGFGNVTPNRHWIIQCCTNNTTWVNYKHRTNGGCVRCVRMNHTVKIGNFHTARCPRLSVMLFLYLANPWKDISFFYCLNPSQMRCHRINRQTDQFRVYGTKLFHHRLKRHKFSCANGCKIARMRKQPICRDNLLEIQYIRV